MYKGLRDSIESTINNETPEAVLFSGGIDSTIILYESQKKNKDVVAITVGVEGKETSDIFYSNEVSNQMGVNHVIYYSTPEEIINTITEAVKIIKTFNPEWVSSTTTLLLGMKYALKEGIKSISSGEGADDIFGSFPFFKKYYNDLTKLDRLIKERNDEIGVMTKEISNSMDIKCILPFRNENVCKEVFKIPIEERMFQTDEIKTKYPLRMAYKNLVPDISIVRPQTMAFSGSGVYDVIKEQGNNISDEEYLSASKEIMNYKSKLEYYLYKEYIKYYDFKQSELNSCPHCKTLKKNKVVCRTCSTIQYEGEELNF